ncbi:ubiquitin-conjugating enzyme E2 J1-like [Halichondria panicea]|uniref:ubiquitin-conjugating enzyme E2 J1-like n=1 Tax=Halichondria panicea TaxID=6063 RepID=UPI00312BBE5A
MEKKYNMRSPGVKRLMREAIELKDPTTMFAAQPLEENLFEWHFTILGPQGTDYDSGLYHGRIILPTEYPMKPPSIIFLTPNGRFELHQKICLSASSYHPELWQPSWSIRTVLLAMIGFMPTEGVGAIGSLEVPTEERKRLARRSAEWVCSVCGVCNKDALLPSVEGESHEEAMAEAADIVTQMAFKSEEEVKAQKRQLAQSASPPKIETQEPSQLRQRPVPTVTTPTDTETIPPQEPPTDQTLFTPIIQNTVAPPQRETGQNSLILIWLIIFALIVLIARRVYLHLASPE